MSWDITVVAGAGFEPATSGHGGAEVVSHRRVTDHQAETHVSIEFVGDRPSASEFGGADQIRTGDLLFASRPTEPVAPLRDAFDVVRHREDADGAERERDPLRTTAVSRRNYLLTCGFIA
jgi:hypothetical protein